MDSSNGNANYKIEAIKSAIATGRLTKDEIYHRLTCVIQQEEEKPYKNQNSELIAACQGLLYEMHTGQRYESRKEESKRTLQNRLNAEKAKRSFSLRLAKRSFLVFAALLVLVIGIDVIFDFQWLEGHQSPDEQQYVISGQSVDPNLITEGYADENKNKRSFTTTNFYEAISAIERTPGLPTWLPNDWKVKDYFVGFSDGYTIFRVSYCHPQSKYLLRFVETTYSNADGAALEFEQNKAGVEMQGNGWNVYITENIANPVAVWREGATCYSLTGPISTDVMIQIINSIQRSE